MGNETILHIMLHRINAIKKQKTMNTKNNFQLVTLMLLLFSCQQKEVLPLVPYGSVTDERQLNIQELEFARSEAVGLRRIWRDDKRIKTEKLRIRLSGSVCPAIT